AAFIQADDSKDDKNRPQRQSRIQIGFAISPVRLDLNNKNRGLVGYGSYLVNAAGGCHVCHTNPPYATGGDPFQGQPKQFNSAKYLGGGVAFGPITSRNITPDAQGRPAGHSLSDFVQIMRTGTDLDHLHPPNQLLQVMPWPVYQRL